jgi:dolichyl-phosphate beta-glucosyltransferase
MTGNVWISVVFPLFNEEERLEKGLTGTLSFLEHYGKPFEIILINDGSTDNTEDILNIIRKTDERILVCSESYNHGKGYAVKKGIEKASGEFIIFTDIDLSTPIHQIENLISILGNGVDIVVGSRPSTYTKPYPFLRRLISELGTIIIHIIFRNIKSISDTQCGFKGFTNRAAKKIFPLVTTDGFGFDIEVLLIARKLNMKIAELPIEWSWDNRSKLLPVRHSFSFLKDMFNILVRMKDFPGP